MNSNNFRRYKRLGEILLEKGIITKQQLASALEIQKESRKALGEILVDMGLVTWEQITEAVG